MSPATTTQITITLDAELYADLAAVASDLGRSVEETVTLYANQCAEMYRTDAAVHAMWDGFGDMHPTRLAVLKFYVSVIAATGHGPSIREVCRAVGLRSTQSVTRHLERLVAAGYLVRPDYQPRAVGIGPALRDVPGTKGVK